MSLAFPLSAITTPMRATDPLVLLMATADGAAGFAQTSCPWAFAPRSVRGALARIASLLSSLTKYALAATGAESDTANASASRAPVCWRIETRACALINGTDVKARKYHGRLVSVTLTSTICAEHGSVAAVSSGVVGDEVAGWL